MTYSMFDLDRAIWHCVPHLFQDGCGERLEYDNIGHRTTGLLKAGEALFFRADDLNVPEWVPKVLRAAFRDLTTVGHFVWEDDDVLEES